MLQERWRKYWQPGTYLTVDEAMSAFSGRSGDTVQLPCKPIPQGFKNWVLAQAGYVLAFLWHVPGDREECGPVGLRNLWAQYGLSKTQQVVPELMFRMDRNGFKYAIFLDNLFISSRLCSVLRKYDIGVAGTCRTSSTKREESELKKWKQLTTTTQEMDVVIDKLENCVIEESDTAANVLQNAMNGPMDDSDKPEIDGLGPDTMIHVPMNLGNASSLARDILPSAPDTPENAENALFVDSRSHILTVQDSATSSLCLLHPDERYRKQGRRPKNCTCESLPKRSKGSQNIQKAQNTQSISSKVSRATQCKRLPPEKGRGLDPFISDLKTKHNNSLPWGELFGRVSEDGQVLQLGWKDNQVVLFMITFSKCTTTVERDRKRPANPNTSVKRIFGNQRIKKLPIPEFIDMYNHFMNGVDRADQLRAVYTTQRRCYRTWKPLWHYLFDTSLCNAAKIWIDMGYGDTKKSGHYRFRQCLAQELMKTPSPEGVQERHKKKTYHERIHRNGLDPGTCVSCLKAKRYSDESTTRKPLQELSLNSVRSNDRRRRIRRTRWGCLCGAIVCNTDECWQEHLIE
jgi:hypothetical protein